MSNNKNKLKFNETVIAGRPAALAEVMAEPVVEEEIVPVVEEEVIELPAEPTFVEYSGKVNLSQITIRKEPDKNAEALGHISKNTVVTIVDESDIWGKLKDQDGWVSLLRLDRI